MRHKVKIKKLQTGLYVTELDRSRSETSFLFQGFLIETEEELVQIKSACRFVIVDDAQSRVPVAGLGEPLDGQKSGATDNPAANLELMQSGSVRLTVAGAARQIKSYQESSSRNSAGRCEYDRAPATNTRRP